MFGLFLSVIRSKRTTNVKRAKTGSCIINELFTIGNYSFSKKGFTDRGVILVKVPSKEASGRWENHKGYLSDLSFEKFQESSPTSVK